MTVEDIVKSPHVLVAGTTGSGKSVLLHSLLMHTLSNQVCLHVLIDLKRVELIDFKDTGFCVKYVSEPEDVVPVLDAMIQIMDERYKNMKGKHTDEMPIYIAIDELADCLDISGVLDRLVKIGRLGRASEIHLIGCTQDPSRNTLSARLMQNFTTCIALRCRSAIESRQIIGKEGAELLPKYGKAIMWSSDGYTNLSFGVIPDDYFDQWKNEAKALSDTLFA